MRVGFLVALHIAGELGGPPRSVGLRRGLVFWAAVPKTAVHEHGDLLSWEDDICASARETRQHCIHPVAQPAGVQESSQ